MLILDISSDSAPGKAGSRVNVVVLAADGIPVDTVSDLLHLPGAGALRELSISRDQQLVMIKFKQ